MSNQYLKLRRSAIPGKIPDTSSIDFGEIALNTYDGLAFIKKSGSFGEEIVTIGSGTSTNISGSEYFIPVFSGSANLVTSSIFQSGSYTSIRNSTGPEDPTNPEILYVSGDGVDTYNLISAHGNLDDYVQINVQNYSYGGNASADIVATKNDGTPSYGYVNMGINGSAYTNGSFVGSANDAYVYSLSNGNLFIGNAEAGKEVIIFNGGLDAAGNSKIWIHDQGTVGINTSTYNTINPPSLQIAPPNLTTYNLIQARGQVDSYLQTAITNAGTAANASADMVAYNDIDPINQLKGFIDVGINSTIFSDAINYPGWQSGDSYVYSDAPRLTIGGATSSAEINLYVGGVNPNTNSKLILRSSNQHSVTGSINITGSVIAQSFTGSLFGTASFATTASYWSGSILNSTSASYAATSALAPNYVLNSSTSSMLSTYVLTSSTASMTVLSASYAATASSADNFTVRGTLTAQTILAQTITSSVEFITGSTRFGSLLSNTHQFTGSVNISGSLAVNGINVITANQTGSITVLSASYASTASYVTNALTASYVTSSNVVGTVTSASYAVTASFAPAYVLNSITSSMLLPYVLTSVTSSMSVLTASYAGTASLAPNYVLNSSTGSFITNSQTSSMSVLSASYSATASVAPNYVLNSSTSSFITSNQTGSFITNSQTSSMSVLSASYAATAALAPNYVLNSSTSSMLTPYVLTSVTSSMTVLSASYAATTSLAPNYVLNSVTASMLSPYVLSSSTGSFVTNSQTSSMSVLSASYSATASSADNFTVRGTLTAQTIVAQTITSSTDYVTGSTRFGSLLSNTHQFTGSVSITGSLTLPYLSTGSVLFAGATDNIAEDNSNFYWDNTNKRLGIGTNLPTAKFQVSSSVVGDVIKANGTLNTSFAFFNDSFGRAALQVNGNTAASVNAGAYFTADGYEEAWFNVIGRQATSGNRYFRFGNLGLSNYFAIQKLNDAGTAITATPLTIFSSTGNVLLQGLGTSTTDDGNRLSIVGTTKLNGNTQITGSLIVTLGITGSLFGTSSWAQNAITSSYITASNVIGVVTSASFASTASYWSGSILNATSASFASTASYWSGSILNSTSASFASTASYWSGSILNATSASYAATSSLPLRGLITGSVVGATLTFTKGDGTTFDLTVAQSGTVSTASYVTSSGVYGPYGANSILSSSYALTASYVANASSFPYTGSAVITGSLTVTGSTNIQSLNLGASQFNNTSSVTSAGTTVISQLATGSYTSCFYNYTIASASNARSGQVMSVWNGATIRYTEVTTTDIGNTATASFAVALSGGNIQLNFTAPGSWTVKNISNLL